MEYRVFERYQPRQRSTTNTAAQYLSKQRQTLRKLVLIFASSTILRATLQLSRRMARFLGFLLYLGIYRTQSEA